MENSSITEKLVYKLIIKRRRTAAIYPTFYIGDYEAYFYPSKESKRPVNHV